MLDDSVTFNFFSEREKDSSFEPASTQVITALAASTLELFILYVEMFLVGLVVRLISWIAVGIENGPALIRSQFEMKRKSPKDPPDKYSSSSPWFWIWLIVAFICTFTSSLKRPHSIQDSRIEAPIIEIKFSSFHLRNLTFKEGSMPYSYKHNVKNLFLYHTGGFYGSPINQFIGFADNQAAESVAIRKRSSFFWILI